MARKQVEYKSASTGLQSVRLPSVSAITPNMNSAAQAWQLAETFGATATLIDQARDKELARREKEQAEKLDFYVQSARDSFNNGDVTKAQLGELHPELVPSIKYKVIEQLGIERGRELIQPVIDSIQGNPSIKNDKTLLDQALEDGRQKVLSQIDKSNEFYYGGVGTAIENLYTQYSQTWAAERAKFMIEKNEQSFSEHIRNNLIVEDFVTNPETRAVNRTIGLKIDDLKSHDETTGKWYGLSNLRRKELIFEAVESKALELGSTELLDSIPDWALNSEIKTKLEKTKTAIVSNNISLYNYRKSLDKDARETTTRNNKIDITQAFANNGFGEKELSILYQKYKNDPDSITYLRSLQNAGVVADDVSKRNSLKLKSELTKSLAVSGIPSSQSYLIEKIMSASGINPTDRAALLNEVESIQAGLDILEDPTVTAIYGDYVAVTVNEIRKNTKLTGDNLIRANNAISVFEDTYMEYYQAYMSQTGGDMPPPAHVKRKFARAAAEAANNTLLPLLDIRKRGEVLEQSLENDPGKLVPINEIKNKLLTVPKLIDGKQVEAYIVTTPEQLSTLPPGSYYVGPDGATRVVPNATTE